MADTHTHARRQGVSPETDELAATLVGTALDLLAEGADVNVLLAVGDRAGHVASYEFLDDGEEALLAGAREQLAALVAAGGDADAGLGAPQRYALAYEGAVDDGTGVYADALLLEFGERGWQAYSAYALYQGKGAGDDFAWTEPAPAGEVEPLL